jgi:ribosome-associated translation inhibitor RaiA
MDVIIQSLGFKAGAELENYIKEKLTKVEPLAANAVRADVTLFLGPESQTDNKHCEIRMEMAGADPFVKKNGETWELAVVDAVDTLQAQLRKAKEKMTDRRP